MRIAMPLLVGFLPSLLSLEVRQNA